MPGDSTISNIDRKFTARRPGKQGRQIEIVDPQKLAVVIARLVEREGSIVAAAQVLELTEGALRPYLSKTGRSKGPWRKGINGATVDKLYRAFPATKNGVPEEWDLLRDALLSERGNLALELYDSWLAPRAAAFVQRRTGRWTVTNNGAFWISAGDNAARAARLQELCYVIGLLTSEYADLFGPLAEASKKADSDDDRYMLAVTRVVEPLLEARESGFIEIGWEELYQEDQRRRRCKSKSIDESRLRKFIQASVEREAILLQRESDEYRAHTIHQRTTSPDPERVALLAKGQLCAKNTQQRGAWRRAYNYFAVMAHNLGIVTPSGR